MSIQFFLHSKDKHIMICNYLEEIINIYDELIVQTKEQPTNEDIYDKDDDIQLLEEIKKQYEKKLVETNYSCDSLKVYSQTLCNHEFILDLIDVTPDRSQVIEYCHICEFVKE
jgi:hypothetical protein